VVDKPLKSKDYDGKNKYFIALPVSSSDWTLYAVIPVREVDGGINMGLIGALVVLVVAASISALIMVWVVRKKIAFSLTRLVSGIDSLANGDISFRARASEKNDEISILYGAFAKISSIVRSLIEDMSIMAKQHSEGNYKHKIDESKYTGAYLAIVSGVNSMTFTYTDDFVAVLNMLEKFAQGDFSADVRQYPGALSEGNVIINKVRENLKGISYEISRLADRAAAGELSVRADSNNAQGEWLKILAELNNLVEQVEKPIYETSVALKKIAAGDLSAKVTGDYKGDFDLIKSSLNGTVDELSGIITTINDTLRDVVEKDMTVRITKDFKGDFNNIKNSVNSIVQAESDLITMIVQASDSVSLGAKGIESASTSLAEGVSVQAQRVQNITKAFEIISTQTKENSKNAQNADKISKESIDHANDGHSKMCSMLVSMDEIHIASANIATIIKTIRDIAFQTNMLALNASVEAARAGTQGKGFNVVADEVRNLAMRSSKASKETQELINDIVARIKEGTTLASDASNALTKIVSDVNSVSRMVAKIASASAQQMNIVDKATNDMEQISGVVHANSATSQQTAAASIELSSQAAQLDGVLKEFKIPKIDA
jgi:methyl-accepting chemotaxis protein